MNEQEKSILGMRSTLNVINYSTYHNNDSLEDLIVNSEALLLKIQNNPSYDQAHWKHVKSGIKKAIDGKSKTTQKGKLTHFNDAKTEILFGLNFLIDNLQERGN